MNIQSAFKYVPLEYNSNENINLIKYQIEETSESKEKVVKTHSPTTKAKRESTNRDVCQQLFLIGMACNFGYSIHINKPRKRSFKTMQLYVIDKIFDREGRVIFDRDTILPVSEDEKVNRRYIDASINDQLIEIMKENNCHVEMKKCKKAIKTKQFERIEKIQMKNMKYTYSYMKEIGTDIDNIIKNQFQTGRCKIQSYDSQISKLFVFN